MNSYYEIHKELQKFSERLNKEFRKVQPSYYELETVAAEMRKTFKTTVIPNPNYLKWCSFVDMDLDIFIEDIPGNLAHDYRFENKRYYSKWIIEVRKLTSIMTDFNNKFSRDIHST